MPFAAARRKQQKKGKKGGEGEVAAAATEAAVRAGKAAAVGFKLALLCVCLGVCVHNFRFPLAMPGIISDPNPAQPSRHG